MNSGGASSISSGEDSGGLSKNSDGVNCDGANSRGAKGGGANNGGTNFDLFRMLPSHLFHSLTFTVFCSAMVVPIKLVITPSQN